MRMRNPENDIPIADGTGFMVGTRRYKDYLGVAQEDKRVSIYAIYTGEVRNLPGYLEKHLQQS